MNIAGAKVDDPQDVSMAILIPSFITSELKTAFQIGFMLFLPFLIIDLVVASVPSTKLDERAQRTFQVSLRLLKLHHKTAGEG